MTECPATTQSHNFEPSPPPARARPRREAVAQAGSRAQRLPHQLVDLRHRHAIPREKVRQVEAFSP
eukprot:COSAG06_NODE_55461_length_289_cov_1.084211_1_plen_65_part_10